MNYDLEKFHELKAIRKELNSLTWMVFGSMFFIIPACVAIVWVVGGFAYTSYKANEELKLYLHQPAAAKR
ncbi:MAG: hypothetical protein J0L73_23510 [Verrucomicrobia bacterium]|nr:hypothetical protein [Verrucomicrobiota bacterium]